MREALPAFKDRLPQDDWVRLGLLSALLGLSWWSTTQGLLGLMTAANGAPGLIVQLTIGVAIAVLTLLISWTVDMLRRGRTGLWTPLFLAGYALLTMISVGFGFGFYWTHIESRASAQRAAAAETERVSRSLNEAYGRLFDTMGALETLAEMSERRAAAETDSGGTCGDDTGAGRGPRYRLRTRDAETMSALRDRIAARVGNDIDHSQQTLLGAKAALTSRLDRLDPTAFAPLSEDEARRLLAETERSIAQTVDQYEAFRSGPAVASAISVLNERIEQGRTTMVDEGIAFTCEDPGLDVVMSQAVAALEGLPPLPEASLSVPLGPDATVAAFGKLANTALSPFRSSPASAKLAGRDFVPLGVAVAVDLFILLLSVHGKGRPGRGSPGMTMSYLETPEGLRSLTAGQPNTALPSHAELLEHCFWWRDAYHLALPVGEEGEAPLSASQRGLTLVAMVLTDAGLLTPVRHPVRLHGVRQRLQLRAVNDGKKTPFRSQYELYRFADNGLAEAASLLLGAQNAGQPTPPAKGDLAKQPLTDDQRMGRALPEGLRRDWRAKIKPEKKPSSGRPRSAADPTPKAQGRATRQNTRPSAYWRSLKPIPKNPRSKK